jgi:hypothetical protein
VVKTTVVWAVDGGGSHLALVVEEWSGNNHLLTGLLPYLLMSRGEHTLRMAVFEVENRRKRIYRGFRDSKGH